MRAITRFSAALVGTLLLGTGCAPGESAGADPAAADAPVGGANGLHLNGLHLNGLHLNGLHLNGLHLNGIQLNGLSLNGIHLNNAKLSGGALTATGPNGQPVTGPALAGSTFAASLSDGTSLTLRIDAVTSMAPDGQLYTVSWSNAGSDDYQPLCVDESGAPTTAVALSGTWDESEGTPTGGAHLEDATVFTFACSGYALAKCVSMGYAPWRSASECRAPGDCHALPLSPYHQACTRMLRADYCGDGTATTRDGTVVDVYDIANVQVDEATSWPMEAEWGVTGAQCVLRTRWPTLEDDNQSVTAYIAQHCPSRWHTAWCGTTSSTYFTVNGYSLPLGARVLLRSRIQGDTAQ